MKKLVTIKELILKDVPIMLDYPEPDDSDQTVSWMWLEKSFDVFSDALDKIVEEKTKKEIV